MTRRITIGGVIFNVEPLGYEILIAYLDAWKQLHPHKIKQWEEQAAEHLLQRLSGGRSVTTVDHVEGICKILPDVSAQAIKRRKKELRKSGYFLKMAFALW